MLKSIFTDPRFRKPRIWSNLEIRKIASRLNGEVVNVSGWRDEDKQGGTYREHYFSNASKYSITNWKSEARGFQGDLSNEIFLDLETDVPNELIGRFDVVFNHTTLEHVFDVFKAFKALCGMSKDVVIVVVPFIQEQHGEYGDYWRFTPWVVKRLFELNGMIPAYINFNDSDSTSIYVVGVGAKSKQSFELLRSIEGNKIDKAESIGLGSRLIYSANPILRLVRICKNFLR